MYNQFDFNELVDELAKSSKIDMLISLKEQFEKELMQIGEEIRLITKYKKVCSALDSISLKDS
ncbi:MAG: hypothetical protein JW894_16255 [Bacteroidales bacterium]|nr:hypothetical protein [Bacteroidales bacterium]